MLAVIAQLPKARGSFATRFLPHGIRACGLYSRGASPLFVLLMNGLWGCWCLHFSKSMCPRICTRGLRHACTQTRQDAFAARVRANVSVS
eukprot:1799329-Pleurochrysis_carterae.AAC.1